MNYLIYDEFFFETAFTFEIDEEIMFANFQYMTFSKSGQPFNRDLPLFNDISMSKQDYTDFWNYLNAKTEKWLSYFNKEVFGSGVPLPYWNLELITQLSFKANAMIVVLDLYYNSV